MHRLFLLVPTLIALLGTLGCSTTSSRLREYPATAAAIDDKTRDKLSRGLVEPGYTPEMVYLALGKPTSPAEGLANSTRDGTWIYENFHRNERDFVRAGFRRRVIFDPVRRSDIVVTEPIDPRLFPHLRPHSVHVIFRDGRVIEVQRVAQL